MTSSFVTRANFLPFGTSIHICSRKGLCAQGVAAVALRALHVSPSGARRCDPVVSLKCKTSKDCAWKVYAWGAISTLERKDQQSRQHSTTVFLLERLDTFVSFQFVCMRLLSYGRRKTIWTWGELHRKRLGAVYSVASACIGICLAAASCFFSLPLLNLSYVVMIALLNNVPLTCSATNVNCANVV